MDIHPDLSDRRKLSDLVPHERNPRLGDIARLRESLREHGQYRAIIVQKSTSKILAGNHTFHAARAEGADEIAVTVVDVDDDEAARILLVDNRTADAATYDDAVLAELLAELADSERGLAGTGFSANEVEDLIRENIEKNTPPAGFGTELPTDEDFAHQCPRCGFEFNE